MANIRIEFETITDETFDGLKSLVIEQAAHHETTYVGDDKKFVAALNEKNPAAKILMARDDDTKEPLGYILYNHYYGLKGQEFYIEDIVVSGKFRSQGTGLAMTEVLKDKAREDGVDSIAWTVAENNPAAVRFYENKMNASHLKTDVYDCEFLFVMPQKTDPSLTARKAEAADLDLLDTYVGRLPGLTADKMHNIRNAAGAEHAAVYIVEGSDGTPKAVGISNVNYSSFRTVYGYKFEMMELTDDKTEAVAALKTLAAFGAESGKAAGNTGHFNIAIDTKSAAQEAFIAGTGAPKLQMTTDPASVFMLYGIGRDIIYAPQAQNVANPVQKKDVAPPKAPGA